MPTVTVPKGQKKVLVRQCLNELGVETTSYGKAKKWFMKNHKLTLADATFYHVRKDMLLEKAGVTPPVVKPQQTNDIQPNVVVDVVKRARELINTLGKDETIRLIDLL